MSTDEKINIGICDSCKMENCQIQEYNGPDEGGKVNIYKWCRYCHIYEDELEWNSEYDNCDEDDDDNDDNDDYYDEFDDYDDDENEDDNDEYNYLCEEEKLTDKHNISIVEFLNLFSKQRLAEAKEYLNSLSEICSGCNTDIKLDTSYCYDCDRCKDCECICDSVIFL